MSNLFGKLTNQLSGQKTTAGSQQSSFSSIQHKLTDAVTGQKHPQDYQSQLRPDAGQFRDVSSTDSSLHDLQVATAGIKEDRRVTEAATVVTREVATAGTKEDRRATEAATVVTREVATAGTKEGRRVTEAATVATRVVTAGRIKC
ncbi:hypothetical protein CBS63078_9182 [Aspergillus niger]|nr:hypothetical protein CBS13152_9487 [Aspergillus niger]KAI2891920.1 hypothetical protein CBS11852_5927 [Aspergillus niger]KAI2893141.1 hypothetical protein CBS63078_9182 [Aspergillus niger]KAI3020686.1 hypothetical protein CBS147347_8367 [Aspergillus niger]KAI3036740.1 hypothetical protein CBS76997_9710 [Aspergillus niger]